jgi:hypothetical protein
MTFVDVTFRLRPVKPVFVDLGGGVRSGTRDTFAADVSDMARDDIQTMMRQIALQETAHQIEIGNPPTYSLIDGKRGGNVLNAQRNIQVFFGLMMSRLVMTAGKDALLSAIRQTTRVVTGTLSSPSNWVWYLVRGNGDGGGVVRAPTGDFSMRQTDLLVLAPQAPLNYAWFVNHRIKVDFAQARIQRGKRKGQIAKRHQNLGFMGLAAASLRRSSLNKDFTIYTGFSQRFRVSGDSTRFGSPVLVIRPKLRRGR